MSAPPLSSLVRSAAVVVALTVGALALGVSSSPASATGDRPAAQDDPTPSTRPVETDVPGTTAPENDAPLGDLSRTEEAREQADADLRGVWTIVYALVAVAAALFVLLVIYVRATKPSRATARIRAREAEAQATAQQHEEPGSDVPASDVTPDPAGAPAAGGVGLPARTGVGASAAAGALAGGVALRTESSASDRKTDGPAPSPVAVPESPPAAEIPDGDAGDTDVESVTLLAAAPTEGDASTDAPDGSEEEAGVEGAPRDGDGAALEIDPDEDTVDDGADGTAGDVADGDVGSDEQESQDEVLAAAAPDENEAEATVSMAGLGAAAASSTPAPGATPTPVAALPPDADAAPGPVPEPAPAQSSQPPPVVPAAAGSDAPQRPAARGEPGTPGRPRRTVRRRRVEAPAKHLATPDAERVLVRPGQAPIRVPPAPPVTAPSATGAAPTSLPRRPPRTSRPSGSGPSRSSEAPPASETSNEP